MRGVDYHIFPAALRTRAFDTVANACAEMVIGGSLPG